MADSTINGIDKVATSEATVAVSQPSIPPVAKDLVTAGEESKEPSAATNNETPGAAPTTVPDSEIPAQINAVTTDSKELTEKIDAANELASQPEKPEKLADDVSAEPASTETATADASSAPNGEAKEPPKPVSVEEVRDQDMPDAAPTQPAEMTGALPVKEPANDDAPKADPAPTTAEPTESDKSEANAGEKRKSSVSEASTGDVAHNESPEDAPAEKKQKTNGAATNGAPKKVGRPKKESKKDKKAPPPVGRTARKTRSQGTAD
ncbi:uncharacterized protein F4812DRAFT_419459 [Daldinia caldariorum]|uniref:uncharacterized protein n=1 Tax=Daldinia caldariorum TaxID=326644 RepID=UPI002007A9B3|nr:uncharacterized protein F4812DRAFT_419459 [Daldinia caldariorum]KAI1470918.1 hypothetical protein F4812DRAFT_419459 [Daldinia caldariorum]